MIRGHRGPCARGGRLRCAVGWVGAQMKIPAEAGHCDVIHDIYGTH